MACEEQVEMETTNESLNRNLRMALVGGGMGAFMGRVHATAAVLDNRAVLAAGVLFASEHDKESARPCVVPSGQACGCVAELITEPPAPSEDQRIDFVSVATPNHTHFGFAKEDQKQASWEAFGEGGQP